LTSTYAVSHQQSPAGNIVAQGTRQQHSGIRARRLECNRAVPDRGNRKESGSMKLRELSADEIDRLVTSVNNDGYGVLHDYLPKQEIQVAARFVLAESAKHGRHPSRE
jgi:hypothetical protein